MVTESKSLGAQGAGEREPLLHRALSRTNQIRIVAILFFVACAGLFAAWASAPRPQQSAPAVALPKHALRTFSVTPSQFANLTIEPVKALEFRSEAVTDGRIALNGDATTPVFSPYSGRVVRVLASVGQRVERGARLAELQASEIVQSQGDLRNANAQLKLARVNEERKHAAYDSKGGSLQDWQQAQAELAVAQTTLASARERLHIFGKTDREIALLEQQRTGTSATYITAPIGGVITDRQIGPGQYLQAGASTPVFSIGDLSTVWLVANVREIDSPRIELGQHVNVEVLALPGESYTAKLESVGPAVDPVTRRIPVRAVLDNPHGMLKPEMFATFSIVTGSPQTAPAVPEHAIVYEGDTAHVWVVAARNELTLREIRTGRVHGGMVEVLSGLAPGDKVVTRGSLFIDRAARPG